VAGSSLDPQPFTVTSSGIELHGESLGEGDPVVLLHGVSATRRYVVHGSKALARSGFEQISYDARGHGESDPAPEGGGYTYPDLAADLGRVLDDRTSAKPVLCGHSMGCHTVAHFALRNQDLVRAVVLIGPVSVGLPAPQESIDYWDRLADGLEQGGVDGFMRAYEELLDASPEWKQTVLRFTRERMLLHRHPEAVAAALRTMPRSTPFDGLAELESLHLPALVVASHDEADPAHPFAVAEAWAQSIPGATFVSEEKGEAPLAWQGGKLAREIAEFCERLSSAGHAA
jgi:pimeloyl-ACP methyl ester carboxylesterase